VNDRQERIPHRTRRCLDPPDCGPEGPEDRHIAGQNLDCLSGLGFAALAGLAVPRLEEPKWQR